MYEHRLGSPFSLTTAIRRAASLGLVLAVATVAAAALPEVAGAQTCPVGDANPCALPGWTADKAASNQAWLKDYAIRTTAAVTTGQTHLCVLDGTATTADEHYSFSGSAKCRPIRHWNGSPVGESTGTFKLNGPKAKADGTTLGHGACSRKGTGTGSIDLPDGALEFSYHLDTSVHGQGHLSGDDAFVEGPVSISTTGVCSPYGNVSINAVLVVQRDVEEISNEANDHLNDELADGYGQAFHCTVVAKADFGPGWEIPSYTSDGAYGNDFSLLADDADHQATCVGDSGRFVGRFSVQGLWVSPLDRHGCTLVRLLTSTFGQSLEASLTTPAGELGMTFVFEELRAGAGNITAVRAWDATRRRSYRSALRGSLVGMSLRDDQRYPWGYGAPAVLGKAVVPACAEEIDTVTLEFNLGLEEA